MLATGQALLPMGMASLMGMAPLGGSSTWGLLCGTLWPRASSGGEGFGCTDTLGCEGRRAVFSCGQFGHLAAHCPEAK